MKSLFCCPICTAPMTRGDRTYTCPNRHSYDRAAEGYTHLLPANQKHSKNPGDDKQMVAARCAFLDKGYYAPLRDTLAELSARLTAHIPSPVLFDSGCGEGYYTAGLAQALPNAQIAGIDISKFAVKRAAKRVKQGEFAVASAYHLPIPDGSVHLLTNIFSPLSVEEFARVLVPGGYFVYVVPSERHLWQMKQVLYENPYENPVKQEDYTDFEWQDAIRLRYSALLHTPEDIQSLFAMTPYAWKTPKSGVARLKQLTQLEIQIGFDIHVYQRNDT